FPVLFATTDLPNVADVVVRSSTDNWVDVGYLVAAVLFILGIKGMTHPKTAVRGNMLGATGMILAVAVTLFKVDIGLGLGVVLGGIAVGAVLGVVFATRVQMTQMPELVALFNGFGGIASVLVAGAETWGMRNRIRVAF